MLITNRPFVQFGCGARSALVDLSFCVVCLLVSFAPLRAGIMRRSLQSAPQDNATPSGGAQNPAPTNSGSSAGTSGACKTQGQFTVSPGEARIAPGGRITFTASAASGCTVPSLSWAIDKDQLAAINPTSTSSTNSPSADLTLKGKKDDIENAIKGDSGLAYIRVTATASGSSTSTVVTATAVITTQAAGNIVIPIIGFVQAGASAAQSSQKFFFNLFVDRPLHFGKDLIEDDGVNLGTATRWFGNVRIASYPQQITSGVAEFATGFAAQVAKLQVNQLARSGEFNMGLDWRLPRTAGH